MKKRIVILSAFLSPHRSGAEAMVEEVSQRLAGTFDITVVTCLSDALLPRGLPKRDTVNGVQVVRVGLGLGFDKWLFPLLGAWYVRGSRPDAVHAVLESYAGLALVFCKIFAPTVPRILTLQSTNTGLLLGPMHRAAQVITAISSALMRRAERFGRTDVVHIPNGIPVASINEACRQHHKVPGLVLSLCRLEPMKGVDVLLRAFAKALPRLPASARLRIVGDGSQRQMLERLAGELQLQERVTFVGRVPPFSVFEEYAQAEVFGGLSRSEAFGNVFLEAQAAGCAVLATNVGGIPDIVTDGVSGILVPPDDVDKAAAALEVLVNKPEVRERLSDAGKQHKEDYDWSVIALEYASQYEVLCGLPGA